MALGYRFGKQSLVIAPPHLLEPEVQQERLRIFSCGHEAW